MSRNSKIHRKWLFASATALALSLPAAAADLRSNLGVDGRLVTIGDLWSDVGDKADIIVLEAPAPGKSKTIPAADLQRIADKHEIDWQRPDYLKRVSLVRRADTISTDDISDLIHEMAVNEGADPDSMIRFFGRNSGLLVPVGKTIGDLEFESFSLSDRGDRFSAVLLVPSGGDIPAKHSINGTIEEVRVIPVFNRSVMPGEVIKASDLSWIKYPAKRLNSRAVYSSQQLVGMTVRRPASTDKPISNNDIQTPVAIEKGAAVTMTVRTKLMILTAGGRALEDGGIGDTIRVLNAKSRLTVDAKIISPGQVEVLSAPSLALAPTPR